MLFHIARSMDVVLIKGDVGYIPLFSGVPLCTYLQCVQGFVVQIWHWSFVQVRTVIDPHDLHGL